MSILCAVGGHEADGNQVYNAGFYFGRCRRCRRDMMRAGAAWQAVPPGHNVVWKKGSHSHSIETDYRGHLPVLWKEADRFSERSPFRSAGRQQARLTGPGSAVGRAGEAEEEDPDYPSLVALAGLVGVGLQLLLSSRRAETLNPYHGAQHSG